jgi:hypothetical protein
MPLPLFPFARVPRLISAGAALVLAAEAVALALRLGGTTAPYDDAFITFRYARNWAEGLGFVYNPGEAHLGTTAPFIALILGVVARLGGADPLASANWISAAALACAAWFAPQLVQEEPGSLAGVTAGLGIALNPMLVSTWGGEWLPAVAAMSAAFWFARAERAVPMAIAGSIGVLLRSEAALGLALLLAYALARRWPDRWRAVALSIGLGLAWVAVAWLVIGRVLPDTLDAKLAQARSGMFMTLLPGFLQGVKQFIKADPFMIAVALLAWHGALMMATRRGVPRLVLLWVAAHVVFFVALALPFYHWYLQPIAWLIPVAMGMGVEAVRIFARAVFTPPRLAQWAGLALALVLVAPALVAEARSTRHWIRIKPDPREALYNEVGRWLATATPPASRVAYVEVGRIGYFSRRPIVDQFGLVTPGLAEAVARQDLDAVLHQRQPEIYLHSTTFGWASSLPAEPWFADVYEPIKVFSQSDGATTLTAYRLRPGARLPPALVRETPPIPLTSVTPELLAGQHVAQTFLATEAGLSRVETVLATFGRLNAGRVELRVERLSPHAVVHREVVDAATIVNNGWRAVRFAPLPDSAGQRYRLVVASIDGVAGSGIGVWYGAASRYAEGTREVNGVAADGDFALRLGYSSIPSASTSARSTAS